MTDDTPKVLAQVETPLGRAEIVEWRWPGMLDFTRREEALMVEMSIPPTSADASACLPELDDERHCFMGTLFVRWPGVLVTGRAEAGLIRVVRCVFTAEETQRFKSLRSDPDLAFLQGMLALSSETMRSLFGLLKRELEQSEPSLRAVSSLVDLIAIETERVILRDSAPSVSGRLSPWQFRRIRQRLSARGPVPSLAELARLCGISPRHLQRQFHALTGRTVADYIETTRMEQAKDLLGGSGQPVKAVAEACGFAHPNSFRRAFQRSTGMTPRAWRQASGQRHTFS